MEEILKKSLELITVMELEKLSVREFIQKYSAYFSDMRTGALIAPECRNHQEYSEKGYIFLIGSYIYCLSENKSVTWLERRRFSSLSQLKNYLKSLAERM